MIYVFIAPGFEEIEGIAVLDILRRAGLDARSVGIGGTTITGSHGIAVECDLSDAQAVTEELVMIVLPGGMPGTRNLEASPVVQRMIDHAVEQDLWIAALCAAPSILGHKKLLEGRRVTCFPSFESELGAAVYTGNRVEVDGKLITGKGPGAAVAFALQLVAGLKGTEPAGSLEASLQ